MPRGKAIMIQGTGSHVGKSVLTAAICRILRQDGYRVAPFKSQNMANNSAVCADGGEIGRAQAEQAEACGIEPTTAMNPILLKPTSDVGSQVVVLGRATGHMTAKEYQSHKLSLLPLVRQSLDSLMEAYDVVVIEGAGSPAEINLKAHDIVNMRTAAMADAKVILVGDIDKGGVFAQFVGTFELLDESERACIGGLIINKFRGDLDILTPGTRYLEERLKKPVLGVVPFLKDLRVAEEDTLPEGRINGEARSALRIDVIQHPHISNFTDFDVFGDAVRFITRPPPDFPDAIVLPGTKSTVADLRVLRERRFEPWLNRARAAGVEIVGICGGFQMLGRAILDPRHVESNEDSVEGLGFLETSTVFHEEKQTARIRGTHVESGHGVAGYEIHMGCTNGNGQTRPVFRISERHGMSVDGDDGLRSSDGRVWGTYVHGVFDKGEFRNWWLGRIHPGGTCREQPLENRFDGLADAVRKSIDVELLDRIIWG